MVSEDYLISPETFTLPDFIRSQQANHPDASGELTQVLQSLALATKVVALGVNRAGLASMLGYTGEQNVQGEAVQKLDEYSDKVMCHILGRSGEIKSLVSEEREKMHPLIEARKGCNYVIALDPLDGSSNIDVNVAIGTIWGIYKRTTVGKGVDPNNPTDFKQRGETQVAAGYTIYGSSTMFVYSTGNGAHGFTLDPIIGEFVLTNPNMKIPKTGSIYSCNEANSLNWSPGVREYLNRAKGQNGGKQLSLRYVGSLVADFHRTMLKGGIFFYPADAKNKSGKLRLLYECSPLAMIVEQAGGKASSGKERILSIAPDSIHQRSPFFIGSREMVEEVEGLIGKLG